MKFKEIDLTDKKNFLEEMGLSNSDIEKRLFDLLLVEGNDFNDTKI